MAADTRIIKRGNGHSYQLDGEKVPGVTTVLSNGIPKPALVGWAGRTIAEYVIDRLTVTDGTVTADDLIRDLRKFNDTRKYPEKLAGDLPRIGLAKVLGQVHYADRDAAANRGTEVHNIAEVLAAGGEVAVPDEVAGHVDAYLAFLDQWQPANAILERVVVNRHWKYMGKFDLIADLPWTPDVDGNLIAEPSTALLDIKTSRSGPFAEVALQLAGYRYAEVMLEDDGTEVPMPDVDWCGVIWIRADGYDVYRFDADELAFRTFLYAKQVGEWLDRDHGAAATAKSGALVIPTLEEHTAT